MARGDGKFEPIIRRSSLSEFIPAWAKRNNVGLGAAVSFLYIAGAITYHEHEYFLKIFNGPDDPTGGAGDGGSSSGSQGSSGSGASEFTWEDAGDIALTGIVVFMLISLLASGARNSSRPAHA